MTDHLSADLVARYRDRRLEPAELVAADFHLAVCDQCRGQLAVSGAATLDAIEAARREHLSYEQMEGYADGTLDETVRDLVLAHVSLCTRCARELKEFAGFIPVMDAPIDKPAPRPVRTAAKATFWDRISAAWPKYALGLAAVAAVAVVVPRIYESRHPAEASLAQADLSGLSASAQTEVNQVVQATQAVRPSVLEGLTPATSSSIKGPSAEVIESVQPVLTWSGEAGAAYSVELRTASGVTVAENSRVREDVVPGQMSWQPPQRLERGAAYVWIVKRDGVEAGRASFRILSGEAYQEWTRAREFHSNSHLMLGALAQGYGMLSEARRHFLALQVEMPKSETAARLLRNLDAVAVK